MADVINLYFANIGKTLADVQIMASATQQRIHKTKIMPPFHLSPVSNDEISAIISRAQTHKAPDCDRITNKLLKDNKMTLTDIITKLINKTFEQATNPENYRPITLLSALNKILETTIRIRLYEHVQTNHVLYKQQHAFKAQSGTTSAACDITNYIHRSVDLRKHTIGIFIDMKKAFDTVSKPTLLHKLQLLGIRNKHLQLFDTFLQEPKLQR